MREMLKLWEKIQCWDKMLHLCDTSFKLWEKVLIVSKCCCCAQVKARTAAEEHPSRAQCSLPESASEPGTLNRLRAEQNRHSMHASAELSRTSSPRAWFVSLEGKPAAEIRYSDSERRRRPVESRETSLDSGVDVSELSTSSGRRAVTLERNRTFIKSSSSNK